MNRIEINVETGERLVKDLSAEEQAEALERAADELPAARAQLLRSIDEAAGAARARYITIAPGQEATYLLKERQAEAFKAAGYAGAVPALVQAEASATSRTAAQACDAILAERDLWVVKAAAIELARRAGKRAAAEAATRQELEAAVAAAVAQLEAL